MKPPVVIALRRLVAGVGIILTALGLAREAAASPLPVERLLPPVVSSVEVEAQRSAQVREQVRYQWGGHAGFAPVETYLFALIRDESWEKWLAFQRRPDMVIPLATTQRVLMMVRAGLQPKKPTVMKAPPPPPEEGGYMLRFLFYTPTPRHVGLVRLGGGPPPKRTWNIISWLTTEEGVFSGRPWDWDNLFTRLVQVGGMLVVGLLVVEILHYIVSLGKRVARGREQG